MLVKTIKLSGKKYWNNIHWSSRYTKKENNCFTTTNLLYKRRVIQQSDHSITEKAASLTNSRFLLREYTFTTYGIHEFTTSTSRIHSFNSTNSLVQLYNFYLSKLKCWNRAGQNVSSCCQNNKFELNSTIGTFSIRILSSITKQ
jgi:hypothetical protein